MKTGRKRHRCITLARQLLSALVCTVLALSGCDCSRTRLPDISALEREDWLIAGLSHSKREKGKPVDDWVATVTFPGKEVTKLLPDTTPAPDGWEPIRLHGVAYNQRLQIVICMAYRSYSSEQYRLSGGEEFCDVWLHDLSASKSRWIGRKRWKGISGFAWSDDGQKLAFMATEIPTRSEPRRAGLYVYDLAKGSLTLMADDGMVGYDAWRTRGPVWSEDGKYLYYASIGRDAMRINVSTLQKERLPAPMEAFAILTVKGNEIIYVKQVVATYSLGGEIRILKWRFGDDPMTVEPTILYDGIWLWETLVSPSRRFLLFFDKRSYLNGRWVLIDTTTCEKFTSIRSHIPRHFSLMSTCVCAPEHTSLNPVGPGEQQHALRLVRPEPPRP